MLRYRHGLQRLTSTPVRDSRRTIIASVAVAVVASWWFFLGSASVSAEIERGGLSGPALATIGVLTAINFGALILSTLAVYFAWPKAKVFIIVVLGANLVVAFLDQVGPLDIAYAVAVVVTMFLVFWSWRGVTQISA